VKNRSKACAAIGVALMAISIAAQSGLQFPANSGPPEWDPNAGVLFSGDEAPLHVNGSVMPPKVVHSVVPQLNAKEKPRFYGIVRVNLWVETDGKPSHIRVIKGLGVAPNAAAVAAVEQYRFVPATLKGRAVKVDINIDIQIY
jgi:protein TonB